MPYHLSAFIFPTYCPLLTYFFIILKLPRTLPIFDFMKIQHLHQLLEILPEDEWIILDVLRNIVKNRLPTYCKEKFSHNVPYFYGHRGICIIWPATIPRGGIKSGVLFGFSHGNRLNDADGYLEKGTNKQVYYKIFNSVEEIDVDALHKLLDDAVRVDKL